TIEADWLKNQQRSTGEVLVLTRDDDVADDSGQLHQSPGETSTASTIPTMAASTGQSFSPDAMRAELPLTIKTVSPTPASTVSTATRKFPSAFPPGSTGLTISSLLLTRRGSLRVATTVPTIFARSMGRVRRSGCGFGCSRFGVLGSRFSLWCSAVLVLRFQENHNPRTWN